jgi:hypothetical protein
MSSLPPLWGTFARLGRADGGPADCAPRIDSVGFWYVRYHAQNQMKKQGHLHVHPRGPDMGLRPIAAGAGRTLEGYQMTRIANGTPVADLPEVTWEKSRRSNPSGNCVELAVLPEGAGIAMRNSRHPEGPALVYTTAEMEAFILGARGGDFDHLIR